jgi:glucose-1-phosphate thymidylyltransferase
MKLILPIAGVGARLRPFSFSKPKGLLKIGGNRVVDHILTKIGQSISQKTPIAVIYGYKRAQIKKYLNHNYSKNFDIEYVNQIPKGYQGDVPYFGGLGEAILLTQEWFEATEGTSYDNLAPDDTLIFLGDMIPLKNYEFVLNLLEKPDIDGIIGTMTVPDDKTKYYGIVESNEQGNITSLVEKPEKTNSNLAIAGVYAFKGKIMKRLYEILADQYNQFKKSEKKKNVEFQFTPALQHLVSENYNLIPAIFKDGILDFGRPDALLYGNRVLLESNKSVIDGAIGEIRNSVVKNPCAIGIETSINCSIIGPYVSIGNDTVIENCNLQNVVIGDNCIVKNIITSNSIIGDGVKIDSIIKNWMILGDSSYIIEDADD